MEWKVDRPAHLLNPAMEAALERLGLGPVTGWAKRGDGLAVTSVLGAHPYSREVEIGPRGGIRSDSLADYRRRQERDRRAAERLEASSSHFVYDRRGNLIGLRLS